MWQQITILLNSVFIAFRLNCRFAQEKYAAWYQWRTFFRISNSDKSEVLGSIRIEFFFNLFDEVKRISKLNWRIFIDRFNFRIDIVINFRRRSNLHIRCRLWSTLRSLPILFLRSKSYWLRSPNECFKMSISLWSKNILCFQSFVIQRKMKDFWQKWGRVWNMVRIQSGLILVESVEKRHFCGLIRGLSGKVLG